MVDPFLDVAIRIYLDKYLLNDNRIFLREIITVFQGLGTRSSSEGDYLFKNTMFIKNSDK